MAKRSPSSRHRSTARPYAWVAMLTGVSPILTKQETAVVRELMMNRHSRDVYANFDLYWSSDPTILLPFNYRPSYGGTVSKAYPARESAKGFVRAVRSLSAAH